MFSKQMIFTCVAGALAMYWTMQKIENPDNGIPAWPLILMWIGIATCFVSLILGGILEAKEADEKEENSPETVASKLQVELIRAKHELDMARIKQGMPVAQDATQPEPPKETP